MHAYHIRVARIVGWSYAGITLVLLTLLWLSDKT